MVEGSGSDCARKSVSFMPYFTVYIETAPVVRIKPYRLAAELEELGSDSDSEEVESKASSNETNVPSLLQMSRLLAKVSQCNPLPFTGELPKITLRLTRLDEQRDRANPRIASLLDRILELDIQL